MYTIHRTLRVVQGQGQTESRSVAGGIRNSGLECRVNKGGQKLGHGVKRGRIVLCVDNGFMCR